MSRRSNYLEEEIRRKESKEPPQDTSREKYLFSVLKYNAGKHQGIRPKIVEVTQELLQINQKIEEQVKVLIGEVESYDKLWDGYANQDLKVIEYNNINYSLGDIEASFKSNIPTIGENIEKFLNTLKEGIKEFLTDLEKAGLFNNIGELYVNLAKMFQWMSNDDLEYILKGIDPFGIADIYFMFHHTSGIIWGDDKYESWKQLYGDFGLLGYGYIGELIFGVLGSFIEPGGGTAVGVIGGGAVGSVVGERWFENSFEGFIPEDKDHTIHWFCEEDWMPWNK